MNVSLSSWLVILLAIAAANLPFLNEKLLALVTVGKQVKPLWQRLIEMFVLYFLVGFIAHLLEARIGNVFSQGWEFYAVTGCLFIVFGFPGFVFRYLRKRHG